MAHRRAIAVLFAVLALCALAGCGGSGSDKPKSKSSGATKARSKPESPADAAMRKRALDADRRLKSHPKDAKALAEAVRAHYELAVLSSDPATGKFDEEGRGELDRTVDAWQRYLAVERKPADAVARIAVHAYAGLAQSAPKPLRERAWAGAAGAVEVIAARRETSENYLLLVQYARLAGQTRKAHLAGQKAIQLAPARDRKAVESQVRQLEEAPAP